LHLLQRPIEIAATSIVPDGPPIALTLNGAHQAVAESRGPERIETGWWRGPHLQRDYYRIVTDQGCRAWIYRDRTTGTWFLHGWFD
jgi:protein ImuB